jgi:hypothetical protein
MANGWPFGATLGFDLLGEPVSVEVEVDERVQVATSELPQLHLLIHRERYTHVMAEVESERLTAVLA